ncbi:MAG TPA: hypothetical protein VJL59_09050 [Anaerolineales bacterium]|nr:hypothetical protein [Anaerolineales bacterium]
MADATQQHLHCAYHPFRQTVLRCNKCGKPICSKCVVRTPVGYRCRECVDKQQSAYATARWYDYVSTAVISATVTAVFGLGISFTCCLIIVFAPFVGGFAVSIASWVTNRRHSRHLVWAGVGGAFLGGLAISLMLLALTMLFALFNWQVSDFGILSQMDSLYLLAALLGITCIYTFICASTVYYRMRRDRAY